MKEIEHDSDFSEQKYLNITKDDVMDESSSLKYINNIINNYYIKKKIIKKRKMIPVGKLYFLIKIIL